MSGDEDGDGGLGGGGGGGLVEWYGWGWGWRLGRWVLVRERGGEVTFEVGDRLWLELEKVFGALGFLGFDLVSYSQKKKKKNSF